MKKTESQYADELIEQYSNILGKSDTIEYEVKCVINDVTNTINYIKSDEIIMSVLGETAPDLIYFNNVLQILKNKT